MSPQPPPKEPLITISQQLHQLAHRNKNQHRLAKWWASFSMLRRHLMRIIRCYEDLEVLEAAKGIDWDDRMEKKTVIVERMRAEAVFIRDVLGPRCYLAFSTVVADNQYASIGLMLLGTLAQLHRLLKPLAPVEEEEAMETPIVETTYGNGENEVDLGEKVARDVIMDSPLSDFSRTPEVAATVTESKEKVKKRIESDDIGVETTGTAPSPLPMVTPTPKEKKKKQKKKGGDAFDDLFSGLV